MADLQDQKYYYELLYIIFIACLIAIGSLLLTSFVLLYQKTVHSFIKNGVYLTFLIVVLIASMVAILHWPLRDEILQVGIGDQIVRSDNGPMDFRRNIQSAFCKNLQVKTNDTTNGQVRVWIVATATHVQENSTRFRVKLVADGRPMRFQLNANDRFRFLNKDKDHPINASITIFQGVMSFRSWLSRHHYGASEMNDFYVWRKTNLYGGTEYVTIDASDVYTIVVSREQASDHNQNFDGIIEIEKYRYLPTQCDPMICADVSLSNCQRRELLSRHIIEFQLEEKEELTHGEGLIDYRLSDVRIRCRVDFPLMVFVFSILPGLVVMIRIINYLWSTSRRNSISSTITSVPPQSTRPTYAFENRSYTNY